MVLLNSPIEASITARAKVEPKMIIIVPAYDALIHLFEHVVGRNHVEVGIRKGSAGGTTYQTRVHAVAKHQNGCGQLPPQPDRIPTLPFISSAADKLQSRNILLSQTRCGHGLSMVEELYRRPPICTLLQSFSPASPKLMASPDSNWLVGHQGSRFETTCHQLEVPHETAHPGHQFLRLQHSAFTATTTGESQTIENNLNIADRFFERWRQLFEWHRPTAGSTALVKMNVASVSHLIDPLASSQGVLIQSGKTLGADDQHLRMGFGRAKFNDALQRFEHWLSKEVATAK